MNRFENLHENNKGNMTSVCRKILKWLFWQVICNKTFLFVDSGLKLAHPHGYSDDYKLHEFSRRNSSYTLQVSIGKLQLLCITIEQLFKTF